MVVLRQAQDDRYIQKNYVSLSLSKTLLAFVCIVSISFSQEIKTIIPGKEYKANFFHELFFGSNWRDLWTSELDVPVLNLRTFAGGIRAYKRGGGFQTKSLKFKGADGKIYKFRSINKDPKKILPNELRDTFVAKVVQDQISTANPLAPIIASPLMKAVGILNAEPILIMLPDSEELGEFRNDYANTFGTIEEHPKDYDEDENSFANSDKIIGLYQIFEKTEKSYKNRVNQHEYLRARLMDMFFGDWDRHVDQWRWARFKKDDINYYSPIPRDRDQAFVRYTGLFPSIFERVIPQANHFSDKYPLIENLTWSGRFLDQRFLTKIERSDWFQITNDIVSKLTDSVLVNAVNKLPKKWFELEAENLLSSLKSRRNNLKNASNEFYRNIFRYPSIWMSNKDEFVNVNRKNDDETIISVYEKKKMKEKYLIYRRTFYYSETSEIRLYLGNGNDRVKVTGIVNDGILIRVIGNKGKDKFTDESIVNGYFGIIPISSAETKTIFYDSGKKSKFEITASTKVIREKDPIIAPFDEEHDNFHPKYEDLQRNKGYDWKFAPWFGYTSDEGMLLGFGPMLYKFGFRKKPYEYKATLRVAYVTKPAKTRYSFAYSFPMFKNKLLGTFDYIHTELEFHSFYGLGNNTSYSETSYLNEYYQIDLETVSIGFNIDYELTNKVQIRLTPWYKFVDINIPETGTILSDIYQNGKESSRFTGGKLTLEYSSLENEIEPQNGFKITASTNIHHEYKSFKETYLKTEFDIRNYFTLESTSSTIASQFYYGQMSSSNYAFYDAVQLGGWKNFRSARFKRFSGDEGISWTVELRQRLFDVDFVLPSYLGINIFKDAGRVNYQNEKRNKWHNGYGVGLYLSFLNKSFIINLTRTHNDEEALYLFKTGFTF